MQGAGLFLPPGKKKPKQVKIIESHATEITEAVGSSETPGGEHEIQMAESAGGKTLSAALLCGSHEVHVSGGPHLMSDKKLVGALDSACNRTCTGSTWLQGYLDALKQAPDFIQNLISSEPESEVFRFGNGGTQQFVRRWRLAMKVGSTSVCIWTSVVNVPSLGLLLGRNFLDATGAVLSFSRRILRADHLDGSHIRLRQLMAGHFALQLLPSCWPALGAQKWRKLGVDGVLECQVSGSEWLKRRFQACRILSKPSHEHLITEHAEKMADISMSGMKVQDLIADMARDSPTFFNSRDTYSSQKASSFLRTNGNGTRRMPSKMGTNGQTFLRPSSMARLRPFALALAATVVALCAIPISFGWGSRSMGASSGSYGHQPFYVKEVPHPSTSTQSLYGPESPRSASASRQNWMGTLIRGRSDIGRNAVGKTLQTSDCEAQGGSSGRVQTRGRANPSEGSVGGSSSQHPWSSRRSSKSQGRPREALSCLVCGGGPQGHCGSLEGQDQANDRHYEVGRSTSSQGKELSDSPSIVTGISQAEANISIDRQPLVLSQLPRKGDGDSRSAQQPHESARGQISKHASTDHAPRDVCSADWPTLQTRS